MAMVAPMNAPKIHECPQNSLGKGDKVWKVIDIHFIHVLMSLLSLVFPWMPPKFLGKGSQGLKRCWHTFFPCFNIFSHEWSQISMGKGEKNKREYIYFLPRWYAFSLKFLSTCFELHFFPLDLILDLLVLIHSISSTFQSLQLTLLHSFHLMHYL